MKVDGRNDLAPSLRLESPYAKGALSLRFFAHAASLDRIGVSVLRVGLVIVLVWIGTLKFADYEANSIVPLVANSPLMSFVYHHAAPEYRAHMNREGELVPAHRAWQIDNGTYAFSHLLGVVIVTLGFLIATHRFLPQVAAVGSALVVLMACTTLSFLVTTPEAWVRPRETQPTASLTSRGSDASS